MLSSAMVVSFIQVWMSPVLYEALARHLGMEHIR